MGNLLRTEKADVVLSNSLDFAGKGFFWRKFECLCWALGLFSTKQDAYRWDFDVLWGILPTAKQWVLATV